eukprot:jgi/Picsp_1/5604/NSC_02963-R1_glutamate delta 2
MATPGFTTLVLLIHTVVLLSGRVYGQDEARNATDAANDKFTVCTLERQPMAYCPKASNSTSGFGGLSIQAFREAALDALGWQEGEDYEFVCLSLGTSEVIKQELLPENGTCDAFIASTTITTERTELGVVWAYPYWKGSVGILARSVPNSSDGWAWTKPFTWELWLALGLTVIILPLIVYGLEILTLKKSVTGWDTVKGYSEAIWRTLWVMIHGETMNVSVLSARIVVVVLAFLALILGASYTANLAAFLTLRSFGDVNSVYDLVGLAVSTVPVYQEKLRSRYGLVTISADINNMDDIEGEADLVANGNLASFLTDAETIQYVVATYPECKVRMLPNTIEPFDYGLAFNERTNESIVDAFDVGLIKLVETGRMVDIGKQYLLSNSPCLEQGLGNDETDQIGFKEVYGLWILVAAAIAIGLCLVIFRRLYKTKKGVWPVSEDIDYGLEAEASTLSHHWEGADREKGVPDLLRSKTIIK